MLKDALKAFIREQAQALMLVLFPCVAGLVLYLAGARPPAVFGAAVLTMTGMAAAALVRRLQAGPPPAAPAGDLSPAAPAPLELPALEAAAGLAERLKALEREKQRVEKVLATAMDPAVARLMVEGKVGHEKRTATVLFADLVSFTTATEERPPESVIEDVELLFSSMEPVLKRFRGHLDKYMGDALMAEFGAPHPSRNHALMAALAALRMQERMAEWQFPWKMRIGIASGPLVVGLIGSGSRKNYTAIGDKVNLAARLQQISPPGAVWVDEEVHRAVQRWLDTHRVRAGLSAEEERNLEGKLGLLKEALARAPTVKLLSEAATLCAQLGDMEQALALHRRALELDPVNAPAELAIAETLVTGEDRAFVKIKGKRQRVAAYEVRGLKPAVAEGGRLPPAVVEAHRRLMKEVTLPEEWMLCIEAAEGAIGHAEATAALSAALAVELGLEDDQVRQTFLAAYLHDIGKKAVPEHLLNFNGTLSDLPAADQALIRGHVEFAEGALREIKVPVSPEVLAGILHHHENFDGTGYPRGLKGQEISLVGRIIKVAEIYDTLSGWRPYREAWTPEAALAEVGRDINRRRVDPRVGEAFLRLMGVNRARAGA